MEFVKRSMKGIFICSLLNFFGPVAAQEISGLSGDEISNYTEKQYSPYTALINGEKYYYPYRLAMGNPFFPVNEHNKALVRINERVYENQEIKYDIYNHLVVLEFDDINGASKSIILRNEWLDYFILGNSLFRKFQDEQGSERFGQVIYEGNITCFYFWMKSYQLNTRSGESLYSFSDPIRHSFILINGESRPYTGRHSFLKCFSVKYRPQIKTYLKKNRVRIRRASDADMRLLMEFINQIHGDET